MKTPAQVAAARDEMVHRFVRWAESRVSAWLAEATSGRPVAVPDDVFLNDVPGGLREPVRRAFVAAAREAGWDVTYTSSGLLFRALPAAEEAKPIDKSTSVRHSAPSASRLFDDALKYSASRFWGDERESWRWLDNLPPRRRRGDNRG